MPDLMDRLREKRTQARTAADVILTRAADEGRDLTPDEHAEHRARVAEEREAADELEARRDEQLAELRAGAARAGRPVLTRADADLAPPVPLGDLLEEPGADRGVLRPAR